MPPLRTTKRRRREAADAGSGVVLPKPEGAPEFRVALAEWTVEPAAESVETGQIYFLVGNLGPVDLYRLGKPEGVGSHAGAGGGGAEQLRLPPRLQPRGISKFALQEQTRRSCTWYGSDTGPLLRSP